MHTKVKYDTSTVEGELKALQDMVDWLGEDHANVVFGGMHDFCKSDICTKGAVHNWFSMCGIQGYPVTAFIDRYYPNLPEGY